MLNYRDLVSDIRFDTHSEFVQKVMGTLKLDDQQVEMLINPVDRVCESEAVLDIVNFLKQAQHLIICGDYDVDGVTSTAIGMMLAKQLGVKQVGYYIPNRFNEGYGVSSNTIQSAYEKGYTDVLLVDNGVKSHQEIELALSLGMKVAVVDHHVLKLPFFDVPLLHPDLLDPYFNAMSAGGLMYLVAEAVGYTPLKVKAFAALSTIADVMPVWGKNREIILKGLEAINQETLLHFDLISKQKSYDARILAFNVIPKINSVGRMADLVNMNTMVQFLLSDDEKTIRQYALQIHATNDLRKKKGNAARSLAMRQLGTGPVDVIIDDQIHEGILGIVANQVLNVTQKPAIVLRRNGNVYKGSARSGAMSLSTLFERLDREYFEAYGGHDFAYGMSVKHDKIDEFVEDVMKVAADLPNEERDFPIVYLDFPVDVSMITKLLEFEPYGEGFQLPLFAIDKPENVRIYSMNGYGYKYVFQNYWLKDAVYFNAHVDRFSLENAKILIGSFQFHPKFGLSFQVDMLK